MLTIRRAKVKSRSVHSSKRRILVTREYLATRGTKNFWYFCAFLWLFAETIKRAASADVDPAVRNRRCRITVVVQLIDSKNLPVATRFDDGHLTALSNEKHLVIRGNRRREILVDRAVQTTLLDYIPGRRVESDQNPAVVTHVEDTFIKQRRRNLRH